MLGESLRGVARERALAEAKRMRDARLDEDRNLLDRGFVTQKALFEGYVTEAEIVG